MYPIVRFAKEVLKFRNAPKLAPTETHISTHMCWPWDLDPWIELNNGRTLTLFDLGRLPLAYRCGLVDLMRKERWSITVAGSSTRYRRRVRMFDRFTMMSRMIGWDRRFIYIDQSMWHKGQCCNQVLIRGAITSANGIINPHKAMAALGHAPESPPLPEWVIAWSDAEGMRPWPPQLTDDAKRHLPG